MHRLDELHTLEEDKAIRLGRPIENRVFPPGADPKGRDYRDLRWSRFKGFEPREMYAVVADLLGHRVMRWTPASPPSSTALSAVNSGRCGLNGQPQQPRSGRRPHAARGACTPGQPGQAACEHQNGLRLRHRDHQRRGG
jgi:hypothetical protein